MPREDDVDERRPRADEPSAAEVADEHVHRRAGEHVARKEDEVVRGDGADDLRREVGRVVGNERLDVGTVPLAPTERSPRERVVD